MVATVVNWLLDQLGAGISWVLNLLPLSPFRNLGIDNTGQQTVIGWLNYFVPIADMLALFAAFTVILLAYYALQVVMRWVKVVGD